MPSQKWIKKLIQYICQNDSMIASVSEDPHPREQRELKRSQLYREQRGIQLARAALVGLGAGVMAVLYQFAVSKVSAFSVHSGEVALHWPILGKVAFIISMGVVGSLAAYLIGRFAPESGGSGIPQIKASLLHLKEIRPIPLVAAKFAGGLAALVTGMSFGREGPTVQIGASVGKFVGEALNVPKRNRDSLIAAGAGAGLAAAFNAPLAGFLFVMEELKREMSAITYGSALIASVCAVAVTRYTLGQKPSFQLVSPGGAPLSILPQVAVLGVLAGVAGVLFNKTLMLGLNLRQRLKVARWQWGLAAGILSGAALIFCPSITGGGHSLAESILSGHFSASDLLLTATLIFFGKLILTSASYGTGLPGGIFAPILAMGATLGLAYGTLVHEVFPGTAFTSAGFATLGMASMLAGSVRAPLTGVVLIVEMTSEYNLLYALLVAAFAADLVAERLRDHPIYEALMERDLRLNGLHVEPNSEPILIEVLIEPHSHMDGKQIKNLRLPVGVILFAIERGPSHMVPNGQTILRAGDMVTMMVAGDKPELSLFVHEAARAP